MKSILNICWLVLFILLVNIFNSCKKEDNIPPVIQSVNLVLNDTIRNDFIIKVEASDNKGTTRLELYANDSLFAKIDTIPFEYRWNTLKMKDGEYLIKAVVYDSEENKTESSTTVVVQNALLTVNLGSVYHTLFPVVVSDEQGNILNSALVQGSGKVTIMPLTPFDNNAINFVYCSTSNGFTNIRGIVHVKRGSEYNMDWQSVSKTVKGIKIHLKNDIGSFSEVLLSSDQALYKISTMADTINLPQSFPYTTGHKLLLQLKTNQGRFYKFITINDIENLTISLSCINSIQAIKSVSFPPIGYVTSYTLLGRINEKDSTIRYYISQGESALNADHFDIYYPAEYFSKYLTDVDFSHNSYDNKIYSNQYQGDLPDSFDPITADFEIVNPNPANFKANITGVFDLYMIEYYNQTHTIELLVSVPVNQKEWKLPDLTTVCNNPQYNFDNFTWEQVSMVNQGSLDWSNRYYDVSIDFEKLNFVEEYVQYEWIFNPLIQNSKQIRVFPSNKLL
jgi:hypothetical protein